MPGMMYYREESWETFPGSKKYNFYVVAVDEDGNEIAHACNDHCFAPVPWSRAAKTINRVKKDFERLKIYKWHADNKRKMPEL